MGNIKCVCVCVCVCVRARARVRACVRVYQRPLIDTNNILADMRPVRWTAVGKSQLAVTNDMYGEDWSQYVFQ